MVVYSPGRANLIGEHTDYNDGYVLPFAIKRYVKIEIQPSNVFKVYSEQAKRGIQFNKLEKTNSWADYVIGMVVKLMERGYEVRPFDMRIDSELPMGAGLSSSAALEVGAGYAIARMMGYDIPRVELAEIAHACEVEFVGVRCGIMDQYTVALAREGHAMFLDTLTKEYKYVPLRLDGVKIFLIDSGVKHELGNSEYNKRRYECERALILMNKKSFREVSLEDVEKIDDDVLKRRARHVVTENERVLKTLSALETDNFQLVGKLLYESHYSLRDNFEVSCSEVDFIISYLETQPSVYGARIVGAGFGGSVIVLAESEFPEVFGHLKEKYWQRFGIELKMMEVYPSEGVFAHE
ncbi:galactokinase [Fervidobacterium thailandense]|uniref:Galactokinase n=1 Tax=Fervidobacterium thailandense TaxID=1008305 RepID=A0A1E3G2D1_9BACT|nr:galactokinase [Fervidobacterium thailandense]ODN30322.1 galactokinase [Fervidobacterium thailandense]